MKVKTEDYYEHPVFNPLTLRIETPAVLDLLERFKRWLWTGSTGACALGDSRAGKTTAIELISNRLKTRTGKSIPSHIFVVPQRDKPTINSIFRNLCRSANIYTKVRGDAADAYCNDFTNFLAEKAISSDNHQVVLIVDEMQRLTIKQFYAFTELHDDLRLRKILLTIFFIGNSSESSNLLKNIELDSYKHVRERFFSEQYVFRSITSVHDVQACLRQYDELQYPVDSGPTYTQYFLPDEYEKGFRIEEKAELIWNCLRENRKYLGGREISMQKFISLVNILLIDYLTKYSVEDMNDEMILSALETCGVKLQ